MDREHCLICDRRLNSAPEYRDLGGDCLTCMAECGDPDAIIQLRELEKQKQQASDD